MPSTPSPAASTEPSKIAIPLNEVAYGVHFIAPDFSAVHFGEYYECIKERFPKYQDQPPILRPTNVPNELEVPPLPRIWFIHGSRLVQLQMDRLVYNWRHGHDELDYPGFEVLFPEFREEWLRFREFSKSAFTIPLSLTELNLTYVNYIHEETGASAPMFTFQESDWLRDGPKLDAWSTQLRFSFPEQNLRLAVTAAPAIQVVTQKAANSLTLSVQSVRVPSIDNQSAIFDWFDLAHTKVHWAFRLLVRSEWRSKWGFHE